MLMLAQVEKAEVHLERANSTVNLNVLPRSVFNHVDRSSPTMTIYLQGPRAIGQHPASRDGHRRDPAVSPALRYDDLLLRLRAPRLHGRRDPRPNGSDARIEIGLDAVARGVGMFQLYEAFHTT